MTSPLVPMFFISMKLSAKILANNRFLSQTEGLAPSPRLGNPVSATGLGRNLKRNQEINQSDWVEFKQD